jgi:hypothetical protein
LTIDMKDHTNLMAHALGFSAKSLRTKSKA